MTFPVGVIISSAAPPVGAFVNLKVMNSCLHWCSELHRVNVNEMNEHFVSFKP
jgi:hypothetical protein